MKKLFIPILIALTLAWCGSAFAVALHLPAVIPSGSSGTQPLEATNTLLSAVTATGQGTAVDLGGHASSHTCIVTTSGTAPTTIVFSLWGSIDNSLFVTTGSNTYTIATAASQIVFITGKPVRYLKGSYDSKTGGDGTTAVTMTCTSVNN